MGWDMGGTEKSVQQRGASVLDGSDQTTGLLGADERAGAGSGIGTPPPPSMPSPSGSGVGAPCGEMPRGAGDGGSGAPAAGLPSIASSYLCAE